MNKILPPILFTLLFCPLRSQGESYNLSSGKNNLIQSISATILVKAYERIDIEIKPVFLNLQDSLQQSNAGITDGEVARVSTITKFTPNLRKVPVPIMFLDAVAFSKNTSIKINDWDDLRNYKFTIVKGVKFIETATKQYERREAKNYLEALELLQSGKTEIVVTSKIAFVNLIYSKKYHNIKAVSESLKRLQLYHFVHKKNSRLIPIITPVLQGMLDSGELAHIRKAQIIKATKKFSPNESMKSTNKS